MSKLGQHAPHGFLSQAGIGIHDLGNGHSGSQRLENVGYGNTRSAPAGCLQDVLRQRQSNGP